MQPINYQVHQMGPHYAQTNAKVLWYPFLRWAN